jgi:hypothetical protein
MMPDRDDTTRWAIVVIHGIGDTEPGHTVDALTWTLDAASTGFEAWGETGVLQLPDPAQSDPAGLLETFPVHMRRGRMHGVETILVESYWADLSRIRGSRLATALGLFRVILNLHHPMDVGAAASNHPAARLVRVFLHAATWLLRGPIAALNLFLLGIYLVGMEAPVHLFTIYLKVIGAPVQLWPSPAWGDGAARALGPVALVVGAVGWRRTRHTDGTWAALWLSLATVGVFGTLGALVVRPDVIKLARATLAGIGVSWMAWLCLMGLALLGVVWEWWSEPSDRRAPLAEAAALAVVQAGLWAVVVTLLGYFLVDRALDLIKIPGAFEASEAELEGEIGHIYRMLVMQVSSWAVVFGVAASVAAVRCPLATGANASPTRCSAAPINRVSRDHSDNSGNLRGLLRVFSDQPEVFGRTAEQDALGRNRINCYRGNRCRIGIHGQGHPQWTPHRDGHYQPLPSPRPALALGVGADARDGSRFRAEAGN